MERGAGSVQPPRWRRRGLELLHDHGRAAADATVRARMYALLGIPLRRPRPSPMRLFVIDRAGKGERRSFQALVRRTVQTWAVCCHVCCLFSSAGVNALFALLRVLFVQEVGAVSAVKAVCLTCRPSMVVHGVAAGCVRGGYQFGNAY